MRIGRQWFWGGLATFLLSATVAVQDGIGKAKSWKLPTVLDNLIHKGDVPVQIGVFVGPGVVPAPHEDAQPRL